MTSEQKAPVGNLPAQRWIRLAKPRRCVECRIELKKGDRAVFFPFTRSVYCRRCGVKFMEELE